MSGAPTGRFFDVTIDGEQRRYYVRTNVLSEDTISKLRALLIKRRRDKRREIIEDFANYGRNLPKAAQTEFSKEIIASAQSDVDLGIEDGLKMLQTGDKEALALLLTCGVDGLTKIEDAYKVIDCYEHGIEDLFGIVMDVASEVAEASKNSDLHPEMEPEPSA